jgi:hypothetical protein
MSGNLPPKKEELPEDFEGQVAWVNDKTVALIEQSMAEGKSPINREGGEPTAFAVVFSDEFEKLVELNDLERPLDPRERMVIGTSKNSSLKI